MKTWWRRAALAGVAAVALVAVALGQEAPVRLELRTGERIEGDLVEFGEHVYRVRSGGRVREVKEGEVARLDFLPGSVAGATSACPVCGAPGLGPRCKADGTPLVRSDLVLFHEALSVLARGRSPLGLDNPFEKVVRTDGSVDGAALARLVADYEQAAKANAFAPWKGDLPLVDSKLGATRIANMASAFGALRTIQTSQAVFREGDKEQDGNLDYGMLSELSNVTLVDSVLGSGRKQGYLFEASYSFTTSEFLWWATAVPESPRPGDLSFFTNQAGVIYAGDRVPPFDRSTCQPPEGMKPMTKDGLPKAFPLDAPRPVRTAEDVLPAPDALPAGLTVEKTSRSESVALEALRARARAALKQSAELNPRDERLVQMTRDSLDGLEGVVEEVAATVADGKGRITANVSRYETVEARRAAIGARTRCVDHLRENGIGTGRRTTLLVAGPFVVEVMGEAASPQAFAALERLVRAQLEATFPFGVATERTWLSRELDGQALGAPFSRLPAGLISLEPVSGSEDSPPPFARATAPEARWLYRSLAGSVTVSLYGGPEDEKSKVREPLGGPTPEQLRPFRSVWLAERRAVTLAVSGKVPEEAVQWLETYVESALADAADTKDARRVDTGSGPPTSAVPAGATRDERCAALLKQIGIAALSYADDRRRFPHDPTDPTGAKAIEILFAWSYLDAGFREALRDFRLVGFVAPLTPDVRNDTPLLWSVEPSAAGGYLVVYRDGAVGTIAGAALEARVLELGGSAQLAKGRVLEPAAPLRYVTLEGGTPGDPTRADALKGRVDVRVWVWDEKAKDWAIHLYQGVREGQPIGGPETLADGRKLDFSTRAVVAEVGRGPRRRRFVGAEIETPRVFAKILWPGTTEYETLWESEISPDVSARLKYGR